MRRHPITGTDTKVNADPLGGQIDSTHLAGGRGEAGGHVLGVDAGLDGMASAVDVILFQGQFLPGCKGQLQFDKIDAGHRLGYRMLDLQAWIDLEKIPVEASNQELDRADTAVSCTFTQCAGGGRYGLAHAGFEIRCRCLLDDFLVAPLQRALALEQMNHPAAAVAGDLHLYVTSLVEIALDHKVPPPEGAVRLTNGGFDLLLEIVQRGDNAQASTATAGRRLEQHRQLLAAHDGGHFGHLRRTVGTAIKGGNAGLAGFRLGRPLVGEAFQSFGRRADENQPGRLDSAGEAGIFRKKPNARVDGLGADRSGRRDNGLAVEVALAGCRAADLDGFADQAHVQSRPLGARMHGSGGEPQASAGGADAASGFASIGDQDLVEHGHHPPYIRNTPKRVSGAGWRAAMSSRKLITERVSMGSTRLSIHRLAA